MLSRKNKKNRLKCLLILVIGTLSILLGMCILFIDIQEDYIIYEEEKKSIQDFFNDDNISSNNDLIDVSNNNTSRNHNYLMVLEIPKIKLKRGLFKDKPYNDVNKNIEILNESTMPNIKNGNLLLAGHSGTGRIAFFKNVDKLIVGDIIYIYYDNTKYIYYITNIYDIDKTGVADINRDKNKTILTLITCRYGTNKQIVVISELIEEESY